MTQGLALMKSQAFKAGFQEHYSLMSVYSGTRSPAAVAGGPSCFIKIAKLDVFPDKASSSSVHIASTVFPVKTQLGKETACHFED